MIRCPYCDREFQPVRARYNWTGTPCTCAECGHTWHQRKEGKPGHCPGCSTPWWESGRPNPRIWSCLRCSHTWTTYPRIEGRTPPYCPHCHSRHWDKTPLSAEQRLYCVIFGQDQKTGTPLYEPLTGVELRGLMAEVLTSRELAVLNARFGLNGDKPKTLQEVAAPFCVTRERIRQIEVKACRKLRHPSRWRERIDNG